MILSGLKRFDWSLELFFLQRAVQALILILPFWLISGSPIWGWRRAGNVTPGYLKWTRLFNSTMITWNCPSDGPPQIVYTCIYLYIPVVYLPQDLSLLFLYAYIHLPGLTVSLSHLKWLCCIKSVVHSRFFQEHKLWLEWGEDTLGFV